MAQQILAELVEGESVVAAHPSCADFGSGESSLSYPSAVVSQTQSRAAAETGICLLHNTVETSARRAEHSVIVESVVRNIKTSYSPALNQQSRLIV